MQAARSFGVRDLAMIRHHLLPNLLGPLVILMMLNVANNILLESSLTFLGLGVDPTIPSWGGMLADGRTYLQTAWWVSVFRALAIMLTVLGLNLLGDWLRDRLDPTSKGVAGHGRAVSRMSCARSLHAWEAEFSAPAFRGRGGGGLALRGRAARRAAEQRLAALGVHARFRSAYKPLVHFFLGEADRHGLVAAHVRYPVHPAAPTNRFTLEAYPLTGLLGDAALTLQAGDASLWYDVELHYADQRRAQHRIFAPNRIAVDPLAKLLCRRPAGCACGARDASAALICDERRATDYELLFEAAVRAGSEPPMGPPRTVLRTPAAAR